MSSNPTELCPVTGIASTAWVKDDKLQVRVYSQDIQGNIRESRYTTGQPWTGGKSEDIIVKARPNSPMAAISFGVDMMGFGVYYAIRLYYISPDNILSERRLDGNPTWTDGDLQALNIEASPVSRLEAVGSGGDISVFYQRPDGALGNIYWNAPIPIPTDKDFPVGWVDNGIVGRKPLFGTGIAAVYLYSDEDGNGHHGLFYQLPSGQLAQADVRWDGKWSNSDIPEITDAAAATNISAWKASSEPTSIRLCYLDKRNGPIERVYSDNQWSAPKPAGKFLPVPASDISTARLRSDDSLRLYVQEKNNAIQEYVWEKGYQEWTKGSLIPVGNVQ